VLRLPEGWGAPERVADTIEADGIEIPRAGIATMSPTGEQVTGSAAGRGDVVARAGFELLERVATLEAASQPRLVLRTAAGDEVGEVEASVLFPASPDPGRWRYARSNGVALHASWEAACERARRELVERDRILRAWYGETRPRAIDVGECELSRAGSYEVLGVELVGPAGGTFGEDLVVAAVFGFPRRPAVPLVFGYGAGVDRREAVEIASKEALQMLAFLWGEEIPATRPAPTPSAMGHLDWHLFPGHHRLLRRFLLEGHPAPTAPPNAVSPSPSLAFADLTPRWMEEGLRVARAICEAAAPLAFGASPFTAHLPNDLAIHPVA